MSKRINKAADDVAAELARLARADIDGLSGERLSRRVESAKKAAEGIAALKYGPQGGVLSSDYHATNHAGEGRSRPAGFEGP